jgi:hypothetical protein
MGEMVGGRVTATESTESELASKETRTVESPAGSCGMFSSSLLEEKLMAKLIDRSIVWLYL